MRPKYQYGNYENATFIGINKSYIAHGRDLILLDTWFLCKIISLRACNIHYNFLCYWFKV
jgi:hypothetical protein